MGARGAGATAIAAIALTVMPAAPAGARSHVTGCTAFDQRVLADINAARGERGIAPLQLSNQLEPVAYRWSQHMASSGRAYDNPRFRSAMNAACPGWRNIGEAVGTAGESTADHMFAVYMRDSERRHTLLSRAFHVVGISTVATDEDGATVDWNTIELADSCA